MSDDTVTVMGVRADGSTEVVGTAPMPARMKAKELCVGVFGNFLEEDDSDASFAMGICEQLITCMEKQHRMELAAERAQYKANTQHWAEVMARIHGLLLPKDVELPGGRIMRFKLPAELPAEELLRALSERIRAIPDGLVQKPAGGL